MSFPSIGYDVPLYALLMTGAVWFFTIFQVWQLQETFLYVFGDPRQYVHVKWGNYVTLHSFMMVVRVGLHVCGIVAIAMFYTGSSLREGFILSSSVLILTRNVVDALGQLYFVLQYQYNVGNSYMLDLSTLSVYNDMNASANAAQTKSVKSFFWGFWAFNYFCLIGYIVLCISYAAVFPPELEIIQILLIISGTLLILILVVNMAISGFSKPTKEIEAFLTNNKAAEPFPVAKLADKNDNRMKLIKDKAGKYFSGNWVESDSSEAAILARSKNPAHNVYRVYKGEVYELSRESASILDSQFPEKQAGIHVPQIGGFLTPITAEKDLAFPHVDYDASGHHGLQDVPLFGVLNPDLPGYHIIFFRVWGCGIGTSSTLDTPTSFIGGMTLFMFTFYACLFNVMQSICAIAFASLLPPVLIAFFGQRQEYVTAFFYFQFFFWSVQCIFHLMVGQANAFVTSDTAFDFNMTTAGLSYNEIPEYVILGSTLMTWTSCMLLSYMIQGCLKPKRTETVVATESGYKMVENLNEPKFFTQPEVGVSGAMKRASRRFQE